MDFKRIARHSHKFGAGLSEFQIIDDQILLLYKGMTGYYYNVMTLSGKVLVEAPTWIATPKRFHIHKGEEFLSCDAFIFKEGQIHLIPTHPFCFPELPKLIGDHLVTVEHNSVYITHDFIKHGDDRMGKTLLYRAKKHVSISNLFVTGTDIIITEDDKAFAGSNQTISNARRIDSLSGAITGSYKSQNCYFGFFDKELLLIGSKMGEPYAFLDNSLNILAEGKLPTDIGVVRAIYLPNENAFFSIVFNLYSVTERIKRFNPLTGVVEWDYLIINNLIVNEAIFADDFFIYFVAVELETNERKRMVSNEYLLRVDMKTGLQEVLCQIPLNVRQIYVHAGKLYALTLSSKRSTLYSTDL